MTCLLHSCLTCWHLKQKKLKLFSEWVYQRDHSCSFHRPLKMNIWLKCDCSIKMGALCLSVNEWLTWTLQFLIGTLLNECFRENGRGGWGLSWFFNRFHFIPRDSQKMTKSPDAFTDSVKIFCLEVRKRTCFKMWDKTSGSDLDSPTSKSDQVCWSPEWWLYHSFSILICLLLALWTAVNGCW